MEKEKHVSYMNEVHYAGYCIGIPANEWTHKNSYLVCRSLLALGFVSGTAMIGTLRKIVRPALNSLEHDIYSVIHTQYGWIDDGLGKVIDPCLWLRYGANPFNKDFLHPMVTDEYSFEVDPLIMKASDMPIHYIPDELFPLRRGLLRETCRRILAYDMQVDGLNMTEAAFISAQPLSLFGRDAKLVYEFLISAGLSKLLPLSHVQRIHPSLAHKASDSFFNDINQDVPASLLAARREQ